MAVDYNTNKKVVKKDVSYIGRDFSSVRQNLIEFAKTYFPTTYNDFNESSNTKSSFDLLTRSTVSEEDSQTLSGNKALYSDDGKLRLIINSSGNLVLQYKLKINNKIIVNKPYLGYGIGTRDNKQSVFITKLTHNRRNKIGSHLNRIGYLSVNNKFMLLN